MASREHWLYYDRFARIPSFKRTIHLKLQYSYFGSTLSLPFDYEGLKKIDWMVDVDEDMAQEFIWNCFEVLIRKILLASNFE